MKKRFLRDIAEIQTGPFGSQLHKEDYVDVGTPIVTVEHLGCRVFSEQNLPMVSDTDKSRLSKYVLKKGDIVFSRVGSVDRCSFVDPKHDGWMFSGRCLRVRPSEEVDSLFLYYFFCLNTTKEFVRSIAVGATMPSINTKLLGEVEVVCPEIEEQRKIADILSKIDDKIEENQKINENLEQQAGALYQSFFSPKSGTQGEVVTLDAYCSIFTGKKNANASVEGGKYKFFTCAPDALQIDSYIFDGNAIIVSGNGAYTGRTRFYSGRFDLYQRTYACTLFENINPDYIFPLYWFVKLELSKKIMGGTRGSAIPYIVMNDLAKFEFIYNEETFTTYMPIFKSLTESIQANEFENECLAEIRDALLPRLMSGELDVSNIQI